MRLAIMQPYIFPYIGYFQLIHAVDKFVFYGDVNFIKQGWINRNRILVGKKPVLFTIPIKSVSSSVKINATRIDDRQYRHWRKKQLITIKQNYGKAPLFDLIFNLIRKVFSQEVDYISDIAVESVRAVCEYLQLSTQIIRSSTVYHNSNLSGQKRVLDICSKESAKVYINPVSGKPLYSKRMFASKGICLKFLNPGIKKYNQNCEAFMPRLSILDVLMFNSVEAVKGHLGCFELQ